MITVAVLSGIAGVALLYASWRDLLSRSLAIPLGWLTLILSVALWSLGAGLEFGLPYALLFIGLIALGAVGLNYEIRRKSKNRDKAYVQQALPSSHSVLQNILIFFVAVPLSGITAILLSVIFSTVLPFTQVSSLVFAVLLMPFLWGLGSYWVCASNKLWPSAATMATLSILCAALIYG